MIHRPSLSEFKAAANSLRPPIIHTPLIPFRGGDYGTNILLKPEILQAVNSFKLRGVFNAVASLSSEEKARGVSTVSAGNTAQALAWSARHFGISARSIMPETAPATKIEAVKAYGGIPVLVPVSEVFRFLQEHLWEQEPYCFIHPWTNRQVMIGHGSLGLEIMDDAPDVDTVFIPVGGGGLLGGVGSAIKAVDPSVRIYAVEPEGCPSLRSAVDQGRPIPVECKTICDGVAVPYITDEMFPLLNELIDDVLLVSERSVRAAIRSLLWNNKMLAEPAGALALAAALQMPSTQIGKSVCLVTGGSIAVELMMEILQEDQ
ncbi:MAG: pyridoxal-phosphate dependent enzyme [Desulfobacterales bacterium]|nr:MAG: pyridoxal-phosphate dependent enzyme [Desulfobacterales bacterium]